MGILNVAPDSFYDGGFRSSIPDQLSQVETMLRDGASLIDIGAVSTKPGAKEVSVEDELKRLIPSLKAIRNQFPDTILSVDTFQPKVAEEAFRHGADLINDIYGGVRHDDMFPLVARWNLPYIMMHMKGTPQTMQKNPTYQDVVAEIAYFFQQQTAKLRLLGFGKILVDPGFGFGKNLAHNLELLDRLGEIKSAGYPLVVGISRKSMIQKALDVDARHALNGTTIAHVVALQKGANILRVHDVREACEAIHLIGMISGKNG